MQLQVNPLSLTVAQREAVAAFILTFPAADTAPIADHTAVAEIADAAATEIAQLDHDQESTLPEEAFAPADPATAAFGNAAPLPPGATAAPFTADVAQSPIAPEVSLVTTGWPATVPAPHVPTSASVAPTAAAPTVSHAPAVELDSKGLPWDARIHAESKNKIADGTWRKKRNLDPSLLAQVEAELYALMGAPVAPLPPAVAAPTIAPPAPIAPVGAAPDAAADPRALYVGLVGRAAAAIQAAKITQADITGICVAHGVPALPLLVNRLDLVPAIAAQVDALITSRG